MSSNLNEFQNATVGMTVGIIEVRSPIFIFPLCSESGNSCFFPFAFLCFTTGTGYLCIRKERRGGERGLSIQKKLPLVARYGNCGCHFHLLPMFYFLFSFSSLYCLLCVRLFPFFFLNLGGVISSRSRSFVSFQSIFQRKLRNGKFSYFFIFLSKKHDLYSISNEKKMLTLSLSVHLFF